MAVDTTHPQYDANLVKWIKLRHLSEGEEAVKEAGTDYLPKLGGQEKGQYTAYKTRASFYNGTARTIEGLSGMIFRKAPIVKVGTSLQSLIADATLTGLSFQGLAEKVVEECLTLNRCGVLVDYPRVEDRGLTRLDAERMNLRPFLSVYQAESIINWQVGQVGSRTMLTQVRLREVVEEPGVDEFSVEEVEQIRVLELNLEGQTPVYQQRIFRQAEASNAWVQYEGAVVPTMQGKPLQEIPFVFISGRDTESNVVRPPLLDLGNVNLSHYRTSADLEHGAHFAALPTPYCFGVKDSEAPSSIGPEIIWTAESKEVNAGMLEFTGTGLAALEKRLMVKEQQMASLGARMLAPEKRQAEAAETAAIHRQGEISVLSSLAMSVSIGLKKCLQLAQDWTGAAFEVEVQLNRDFLPTPMSSQMLTALFQLVQGGRISQQTFFENLQRGEIIYPGKTFDEEELDRAENAIDAFADDEEDDSEEDEA